MDDMTYEKIVEEIKQQMETFVDTMEKTCQYKSSSDRYCSATSQRSCMGCRFFAPTIHHLVEYLYEKCSKAESELITRNKEIVALNKYIEELKEVIRNEA